MNAAALATPFSAAEAASIEAAYTARCEARALLLANGLLPLHEAVDELQAYAEQSGLIDRVGQDEVQRIMEVAFIAVDLMPEPDEPEEPTDREPEAPRARSCHTAGSTIAAFWYVVSLRDPERFKAWLRDHPKDAPFLLKLLEEK